MAAQGNVIAIQPVEAVAGCGGCARALPAAACASVVGTRCGAPRLSGPLAQTRRLLLALGISLGEPVDGEHNRLVRALLLAGDEVELQLAVNLQCAGGAELADAAFRTLRRLLPDTDILVTTAG